MVNKAMMKFQDTPAPRLRIKHPKRVIIIALVSLLVIAAGIYAFLSYQNWQQFDQRSQASAVSLKTAIDESLGNESSAETPAEQIDKVINNFEDTYGDTPCETTSLYSWQTVVPAVNEMQNSCTSRSSSTLAVINALKPLSQFLKDQKVAAATIAATIEATKEPSDYSVAATLWQENTKTLPGTEQFAPVTNKINEVTGLISSAYSALASASTVEDKAAFDAAITSLQTAYQTIPSIHAIALEAQTSLTTAVTEAYKKL